MYLVGTGQLTNIFSGVRNPALNWLNCYQVLKIMDTTELVVNPIYLSTHYIMHQKRTWFQVASSDFERERFYLRRERVCVSYQSTFSHS
jgi:hypothetical protein